ncbi:MAG: phytoene desaturase family protein [Bacteroidota bacterium]
MKTIAVIGGGLGGLATATRLAHKGHDVTVFEKNSRVGGKMDIRQLDGYTFDTGPTLLTMPFVLEDLFSSVGARLGDYVETIPVEPLCRYFFSDGSSLDAFSDLMRFVDQVKGVSPEDASRVNGFFDHARSIYDAAAGPFLFSEFGSLRGTALLRSLRYLPAVRRIDAFRTLSEAVASHFGDSRIQQLFNRFATYNGSSPYLAPATLAIIPFVEFTMGGWYVRGGMYRLVQAIEKLARDAGVTIVTGKSVRRVLQRRRTAVGVELENGEQVEADAVVCNADALYAYQNLLGPRRSRRVRRFDRLEVSLAGFVLLLGARRSYPQLSHHNIFFSADYQEEFRSLFERHLPASDPTIYVSISSKADPSHAPPGGSNLFVLVNVPPLSSAFDWQEEAGRYRTRILETLGRHGVEIPEEDIEAEEMITPARFQTRYNAHRGSIYGTSSNGRMAAFLRPANRSRGIRNLFFAGGSAHPGGGIPLVLLSGKITAGLVEEALH